MRAALCKAFPCYTFESLDRLVTDRETEIFAAAEWLAEDEKKALERKTRRC